MEKDRCVKLCLKLKLWLGGWGGGVIKWCVNPCTINIYNGGALRNVISFGITQNKVGCLQFYTSLFMALIRFLCFNLKLFDNQPIVESRPCFQLLVSMLLIYDSRRL